MENKLDLNHQIKVNMIPQHQKNRKVPGAQHVFSYEVTIFNNSIEELQLIRRHWFITDGVLVYVKLKVKVLSEKNQSLIQVIDSHTSHGVPYQRTMEV